MGKARRSRQGFMVRLDEHDAELEQWLGQFAQSQSMSKVVKLACYMLAGLEPPEPLRAVMPQVDQARYAAPFATRRAGRPRASEHAGDTLVGVMQELAALREAVTNQQPGYAPPVDDYAARPLSDSRRRRRDRGGGSAEEAPPLVEDEQGRVLAASGLDMSASRRTPRIGPARADFSPQAALPPFDAQTAQERLLMSIRGYGRKQT